MEVKVPVTQPGQSDWVNVRIDRTEGTNGVIDKTISVTGNPLPTLEIQPWLEEKALLAAPAGYTDQPHRLYFLEHHQQDVDHPNPAVVRPVHVTNRSGNSHCHFGFRDVFNRAWCPRFSVFAASRHPEGWTPNETGAPK